jgi:hypothetical protein
MFAGRAIRAGPRGNENTTAAYLGSLKSHQAPRRLFETPMNLGERSD